MKTFILFLFIAATLTFLGCNSQNKQQETTKEQTHEHAPEDSHDHDHSDGDSHKH